MFKPMLCATIDVVPEDPSWVLEAKHDGWRFMCEIADGGVTARAGRNGNSYSGKVPYIEAALIDALPDGTVVDGELCGRVGWGDVQGVMTRGHGPHVPSHGIPALNYVVFDILFHAGEDIRARPWHERRAILEALDLDSYDYLNESPVAPSSKAAHDAIMALGYEGTVVKHRDAGYVCSRSPLWAKCKPQVTAEAIVTGFKPGEAGGQWDGKVGAFIVKMIDTGAETSVKCGTDERHYSATNDPASWLGVVIEVEHHGFFPSGKPRHPQFFRRRDDRDAAQEVVPAKVRTTPAGMPAPRAGGPSKRNYAAMGEGKLRKCLASLEAGEGDAHDRCVAAGGDPAADLVKVREIVAGL